MNEPLVERRCKPCEGGVPPLAAAAAEEMLRALHADWRLANDGRNIEREFAFANFSRAIGFANAVAWIATVEGHHPVLQVSYGKCLVSYTTNAVGGLTENDFICAAKIDRAADEA